MHDTTTASSHLLGLTAEEAQEFASLAKAHPVTSRHEARARDARWIELYLKHEVARIKLMQTAEATP